MIILTIFLAFICGLIIGRETGYYKGYKAKLYDLLNDRLKKAGL